MNKDSRIVELIHELTQLRHTVTFSRDLSGMLTVAVDSDHSHCGQPHGTLKACEKDLLNWLAGKLEEAQKTPLSGKGEEK